MPTLDVYVKEIAGPHVFFYTNPDNLATKKNNNNKKEEEKEGG